MDSFFYGAQGFWPVRNHELGARIKCWFKCAILLPCIVISALASGGDERPELFHGRGMTNKGFSQEVGNVGSVGVVVPMATGGGDLP